jgi:hypothetical protein
MLLGTKPQAHAAVNFAFWLRNQLDDGYILVETCLFP